MFVNQENVDDIKKYWVGCFVKFKECGEQVFYINKVDMSYIYAEDSKGEQIQVCLKKGYTLDYVIPKKTTYQYGDYSACLSRIPARMWKKGLNKANTQFEILRATGWVGTQFNVQIIEGFVNKPSYYDYATAFQLFQKTDNQQSCALSPRISVNRNGSIYVDTTQIGRVENKDDTTRILSKKLFIPELSKVFPGLTIKGV